MTRNSWKYQGASALGLLAMLGVYKLAFLHKTAEPSMYFFLTMGWIFRGMFDAEFKAGVSPKDSSEKKEEV